MIAGIAALGGISASIVNALKNRGDHRLSALQATVTLLSDRVEHLEKALICAESRADEQAVEAREAERLLWHVVSYLREVIAWSRMLHAMIPGEKPTQPQVPDTINKYL